MIGSAVFYFVISFLTGLFARLAQKKKGNQRKVYLSLSVFVPSVFAGLRYGIGTDYYTTYKPYFEYLRAGAYGWYGRGYLDPGFYLVNKIVILFRADFQWVLFICSIITFVFLQLALNDHKEHINIGLATFLFMLLYYQMSYNIVRQVLAMTIVLYATKFIISREPLKYTMIIILAASFHKTALVVLPFYIFLNIITKRRYKILFIGFYVGELYFVFNFQKFQPILALIDSSGYYVHYLNKVSNFSLTEGFIMRTLPFVVAIGLCWDYYKKNTQKRTISIYMNMFWFGTAIRVMAYMTAYDAERIGLYFLVSQVIMIPYIINNPVKSRKRKIASIVLISSVIFTWFWDSIYLANYSTVPYRWVFSTTK